MKTTNYFAKVLSTTCIVPRASPGVRDSLLVGDTKTVIHLLYLRNRNCTDQEPGAVWAPSAGPGRDKALVAQAPLRRGFEKVPNNIYSSHILSPEKSHINQIDWVAKLMSPTGIFI